MKYEPGQIWESEKGTREIIEMDKYDIVYSVKMSRNSFGTWVRRSNAKLK